MILTTEEEDVEALMGVEDNQVRAEHYSSSLLLVVVHLYCGVAWAPIRHHLRLIPLLKTGKEGGRVVVFNQSVGSGQDIKQRGVASMWAWLILRSAMVRKEEEEVTAIVCKEGRKGYD